MKRLLHLVFLISILQSVHSQNIIQPVNAVLGDESFIATYGIAPNASTNEQLRLMTHLAYVEVLLREKVVSNLSPAQELNRAKMLQLLHDYWTAGIFPVNEAYVEERRPCFIDASGNICAVGYLVEKTAGRKFAEMINERHQYDYLLEMNEPAILDWATENGLTLEECAMIQPQYTFNPPSSADDQPIPKGYGITSGILGGLNVAMIMTNLSRSQPGATNKLSYVGLVTGAGQIILGITKIRDDQVSSAINAPERRLTYKGNNTLSYLNVAAGTATMVTSAINIIINKKLRSRNCALKLYSYPGINKELNLGLSIARRI